MNKTSVDQWNYPHYNKKIKNKNPAVCRGGVNQKKRNAKEWRGACFSFLNDQKVMKLLPMRMVFMVIVMDG